MAVKKKISDITRDFDFKSVKDTLVALKDMGMEKTTGGVLDDNEYAVFLQVYTAANQIANLDAYLDGVATLSYVEEKPQKKEKKADAPEAKETKPEEKKAEPSPEEKKMQDILSRVSVSSSYGKKPSAPSQKKETTDKKPAQQKPVQQPKPARPASPEKKPEQPQAAQKPQQRAPINQADLQKKMEAFRHEQAERLEAQEKARKAMPALAKKEEAQAAKQQAPAKAPEAPKAPAPTPAPEAPKAPQKPKEKKEPVDRFSRFEKPVAPAPKKEEKPVQKQEKRNKTIIEHSGPISGVSETVIVAAPKTRVVDTRTTEIDLSRYDERLDRFGTTSDNSNRQKLKKQDNRSQGKSAKDKNRIAKEKIKKMEMELARKKQLEITVPDEITVGELAIRLKKTSAEVIKQLIKLGMMATVNQVIDYDTAYLVAEEFGALVTKEVVVTIEEKLFDEKEDTEDMLLPRSPVVCVMGHVDHGKTSLLDAIRHTNVTKGEAGGITQAIGAYRVKINDKELTFLDTPGHEAFTAMRARGAQATDIAILVVAGDDGIMPQTVEAINHAKAAGIEIVVAINKMDKPQANADHVMQELVKYELLPESWGGETICVPVSALTGMGIEDLLESVLLVAEMKELKANPDRRAKGLIIESRLDRGRGPVATVLVQNGTLHQGDIVIAGTAVGHVRAMMDDKGKMVKVAGPSTPVEIIGLGEVPQAGDEFNAVEDEKMARSLAEQRKEKAKEEAAKAAGKVSLDDLFARISDGAKTLNVIVKADVDGSAEAVKASLMKIAEEDVRVNVIHAAVGGITENDVMLASASDAIIVGFNVRPDKNALDMAERQGVDVRTYRIIYECIQEITASMKGLLAPKFKEEVLGHAQVRQTIHVPGVGTIAGSYVQDGKITRRSQIRVVRDGIVVFEDKISSLKRFKDDVKEVMSGYECGIGLDKFNDIKENDILEAFEMVEIER